MEIGPITARENNKAGVFATDLIQGESIILELYEPLEIKEASILHINKVIHAYKDMFQAMSGGFGQSSSCNVNINCPAGNNWQQESNAVAMLLLANGDRFCSGALVNNATNNCQNFVPNLLTAFHCLDNNVDNVLQQ